MQQHSMLTKAMVRLFLGTGVKHRAEAVFYRALLDSVGVYENPDLPALAGAYANKVEVNPTMFDKLSLDEAVGVLAHEARHLFQNTLSRRGSRDPLLYNIASDLVINESLKESGFSLPASGVHLKNPWPPKAAAKLKAFKVNDTSEEEVYSWLYEAAEKIQFAFDEDLLGEPGSEQQQALGKVQIAGAASAAAKIAGSMPDWLEKEIQAALVEETPWPEAVRDWMTSHSNTDLSWAAQDKVILANYRLCMPDFYSEAMGELVIIQDTSGSVTDELLSIISGHVSAGLAVCQPEKLHLIYCDADIQHAETVANPTSVQLKRYGGGGTDFRPPFEWVKKNAPNACGIIYFTDGYGEFPKDPGTPTLWCILKGCNTEVPFGRVVEIDA